MEFNAFERRNSALVSAIGEKARRTVEKKGNLCSMCMEIGESMGDDQMMQDCGKACRRCAESCKRW